jgi:hypothetical protein
MEAVQIQTRKYIKTAQNVTKIVSIFATFGPYLVEFGNFLIVFE